MTTRQERAGSPDRSFAVAALAAAIALVAVLRMATVIDNDSAADADIFLWAVELAGAFTAAGFGAILVRRSAGSAAGWLLQLAGVGLALSALTDNGAVVAEAWQPFGTVSPTVQLWVNLFGRVLLLAAAVVSLPDRAAPGRAGSGAPTAIAASLAVGTAAGLLLDGRAESLRATNVGFGNRAWVEAAAAVPPWVFAVFLAVHVVVLCTLAHRRGDGEPTWFQIVGWGLAAAAVPSAAPAVARGLPDMIDDVLVAVTWPVLPVVSVIAGLRALAWTFSRIVSRTIVWVVLSLGVLVLQSVALVVAATAGARLGLAVAVAFTFLVAAGFGTMQRRLRSMIDRALYGVDRDPSAALADLGDRLEHAVGPDDVLADVASAVSTAFGCGVSIELATADGSVEVARAGVSGGGAVHRWPLIHQGECIGHLVAQPPEAAPFRPSDLAALASLVPQAGVVAYSVRVTVELRRSQEALVAAVEDERRRLQHDLHDGLGPALAGVALGLRAARNQLHDRAVDPEPLLEVLTTEVEAGVEEVRRIVHGLRPVELDQLGLVGAIRSYADRCTNHDLAVRVEVDGDLPALPAAVEVATYRVAVEALTNVVRHSRASACSVTLRGTAPGLELEIRDDGIGIRDGVTAGVGLSSMRARASGVGGSLVVTAATTGGTRVIAHLPLGVRSA